MDLDQLIENIEAISIRDNESSRQETVACIDDILDIIEKSEKNDYTNEIESIDKLIDMIEHSNSEIDNVSLNQDHNNEGQKESTEVKSSVNESERDIEMKTQSELDSLLELLDSEGYIKKEENTETPKKEDIKEEDPLHEFRNEMEDFIKGIEDLSKEEERFIQKQPITPRIDDKESNNNNNNNESNDSERCYKCKEYIYDEKKLYILNRYYHLDHFECFICQRVISNERFFEYNNEPYCKICFESKFCPQCYKCKESIYGPFINALDKSWHQSCFKCSLCSNQLTGNYFEKEKNPYCYGCFNALSSICKYCNEVIYGNFISALGFKWHPEHFKCFDCNKTLSVIFFELNGSIYCDDHYYERKGEICEGCKSIIKGPSIDAIGKKWHSNHFVCSFCSEVLAVSQFTEKNGKAYCKGCYERMFL